MVLIPPGRAARGRGARRGGAGSPGCLGARRLGLAVLSALVALLLAPGAFGQTGPVSPEPGPQPTVAPAPETLSGYIEGGFNYHVLTGGQGNWFGQYLRGAVDVKQRDIWTYEIVNQEKFRDHGVFFSVGDTHVFDEDWYGNLSLGTSAGGFFWPRFRADAFINRKWLAERSLITTLGVGYYDAKDVHYDLSGYLGAAYYFPAPWIVEGGLRYNVSQPGSVTSLSPFLAVTYGRNKAHYLTLRYSFGREAYQLVGPSATIVDFHSQVVSFTWRQWLTRDWGFRVFAEHYNNPFYERNGLEVGIFRDF